MPLKTSFKSEQSYYSTLFHELVHWTGAQHRLKRQLSGKRGVHLEYAAEELVAEMGAAFLSAHFGLKYTTRHAAYLKSYLKHFQGDTKALQKASAKAYKAMDFILDFGRTAQSQETN